MNIVGSVATAAEALAYLLLAAVLGAVIGLERRWQGHVAGPHTSALLAVGSAMYVLLAVDLAGPADLIRAAGQVAVGIGFLCGGVIVHNGFDIRGLNTAATLWCIGAVGTLVGARSALVACVATGTVVMVNVTMRALENHIARLRPSSEPKKQAD